MDIDTNAESQGSAEKQRRGDRVKLDVGGKVFSASVTTLASNSSYFESLFSDEWRNDDEVFVDFDPRPFAVLLSFMRHRYIEAEALTKEVLVQAVFLGMEELLAAVKVAAYRNTDPMFSGSDEETCAAFDEAFGGITEAVSSGILPSRLAESLPSRKEYGHIKICSGTKGHKLDGRFDLVVVIDVPSCPVNEVDLEAFPSQTTWYATFLDALNFLSRRGFTMLEKEIQEYFLIDGEILKRLTFSRIAEDERPLCGLSEMIIRTRTEANGGKYDAKEFACIVDCKTPFEEDEFVCVYADTGETPWLVTRENRIGNGVSIFSSKLSFDDNVAPGMDWLQKESYRQEEKELGDLFADAWNAFHWGDTLNENGDWNQLHVSSHPQRRSASDGPFFLKLFSRRCKRRKDDYRR